MTVDTRSGPGQCKIIRGLEIRSVTGPLLIVR